MATYLRDLVARIGFKADLRPLDNVDKKLGKATRAAGDLNGALTHIGAAIAGFATIGAALAALDKSLAFGKQIGQIQTLMPGAANRVAELRQGIIDLSIATGKSTEDISAGVYEVLSSFGDLGKDTIGITKLAAQAATAGATDTKTALNLLSAVTLAYGDTSAAANAKVSDLGFTAVKLGKLTFPELASSIGIVTPIAKQLNVSTEELFAAFGTLSGVTGTASEVATQYRAILVDLIKPTDKMRAALNKLGIANVAQAIKSRGVQNVLKQIIGTTDGTAEQIGKLFGRAEGLGAAMALTGSLGTRFDSTLDAMRHSAGATAAAYAAGAGGANAMGTEVEKADAKIAAAVVTFGDHMQAPFVEIKKTIALVADAAATDLLPIFDILAGGIRGVRDEADATNDSLEILFAAVKGLSAVGVVLKAVGQQTGNSIGYLGAVGATAAGSLVSGESQDLRAARLAGLADRFGEQSSAIVGGAGRDLEDIGASIENPREYQRTLKGRREMATKEANERAGKSGATATTAAITQNVALNGDINVTVPLGKNGELDAKDVGAAIGRQLYGGINSLGVDVRRASDEP